MAIKSILVAYSGEAGDSGALHLALQMAGKYGAHLTGVVSHGPSVMETQYSRLLSRDVLEILRDRDAETVAQFRTSFEERVAGASVAASFLDLQARAGFTLTEASRVHDIVIMGRRASEPGREHFGVRPEEVSRNSGRPVILVPRDYSADALNEHALVAWDGGRAAARALGDAMHILETKDKVTVLTVNSASPEAAPGESILQLLERHGIAADHLHRDSGRHGISGTILETCRDVGAGLLVMGAYEHSSFGAELFGSPTRDIMDEADLPVLMSH